MSNLQPHQQRVVDERIELVNRMERLVAFLRTDVAKALDKAERRRLFRQVSIMALYAEVLEERMEAFGFSPFTG